MSDINELLDDLIRDSRDYQESLAIGRGISGAAEACNISREKLLMEIAYRDEVIAKLKEDAEFWYKAKDSYVDFESLLNWDKSHSALMLELEEK